MQLGEQVGIPSADDLLLDTVIIDAEMACCGHDDRRGTSGGHDAQSVQRQKALQFRYLSQLGPGFCGTLGDTAELRSYAAAHRAVMLDVTHSTTRYENNRAEVSHRPTRQRERQVRRFKSPAQAQRFLSVHSIFGSLFRLGRHLLRAVHSRLFRARAFDSWQRVTCA